jgi:hypothetical protein
VSGRFWRNKGDFQFEEATDSAGLSALNWVCRDWCQFFDTAMPRARLGARIDPAERRPYFADAVFGDFDNDGWVDFVVLDRSEMQNPPSRATLFMNKGDGTFEPKPTTFSGLDGSGICGEAADLNNDGFLDLVLAAGPDNSGLALGMDRYGSKVCWNTGLHGARENHWLRLRFGGVSDAELIGARIEALEPGTSKLIGMRVLAANQSYKSGSPLEVHFGLGRRGVVDLRVTFLSDKVTVSGVAADCCLELDAQASGTRPVDAGHGWALSFLGGSPSEFYYWSPYLPLTESRKIGSRGALNVKTAKHSPSRTTVRRAIQPSGASCCPAAIER